MSTIVDRAPLFLDLAVHDRDGTFELVDALLTTVDITPGANLSECALR